jgi:hypothetical protein
MASCKDVT